MPDEAEMLKMFVAERDVLCPNCGFFLRAVTSPTCPECGQALALRVGLAEPKLFLWLAGLIPLAMTMGFGVVVLLLVVVVMTLQGGMPPVGFFIFFISVAGLGCLFTIVWVCLRSPFRGLSLTARCFWVALAWIAPIGTAVVAGLIAL
ncbi:MAG: hypothetical protein AAF078_00525 [Planctomycetota bacterium]